MELTSGEKLNQTKKEAIRRGFAQGLPIYLGYIPIAIAYGVLATQSGLTIGETTLMSAFVYAGASQFMGVNMVAQGALFMQIVIATFVLNFRHFILSLSLMNRLKHFPLRVKALLSVTLTDESFAVSMAQEDEEKKGNSIYFYLTMFLVAYFSWVVGSLFGAVIGDVLPSALSDSMGIALYAMFIGLLIPSVKKEWKFGLIAVISMLLNFILINYLGFSDELEGWAIVIATLAASSLGIVLLKGDEG